MVDVKSPVLQHMAGLDYVGSLRHGLDHSYRHCLSGLDGEPWSAACVRRPMEAQYSTVAA